MQSIVLIGEGGVGKSTVSRFIEHAYGYREFCFSDPLKIFLVMIGYEIDEIFGSQDEKLKINQYYKTHGRQALQKIGTELMREKLQEAFPEMDLNGYTLWARTAEIRMEKNPNKTQISDCRFPDEQRLIKNRNGITIKIIRENNLLTNEAREHKSEAGVKDLVADYTIINDGSIVDLLNKVHSVICEITGTLYPIDVVERYLLTCDAGKCNCENLYPIDLVDSVKQLILQRYKYSKQIRSLAHDETAVVINDEQNNANQDDSDNSDDSQDSNSDDQDGNDDNDEQDSDDSDNSQDSQDSNLDNLSITSGCECCVENTENKYTPVGFFKFFFLISMLFFVPFQFVTRSDVTQEFFNNKRLSILYALGVASNFNINPFTRKIIVSILMLLGLVLYSELMNEIFTHDISVNIMML